MANATACHSPKAQEGGNAPGPSAGLSLGQCVVCTDEAWPQSAALIFAWSS